MYEGDLAERADARNLEEGNQYAVGIALPLMPAFDPVELAGMVKDGKPVRMQQLTARTIIKVLRRKLNGTCPWYEVELDAKETARVLQVKSSRKKLKGWVSSIALAAPQGVFEILGSKDINPREEVKSEDKAE